MRKDYIVELSGKYKGVRYAVIGISMGHRCGYVEVEKPTKQMINSPYDLDFDVHGGITYGQYSKKYPIESESETFWLGFDCAHSCDAKDFELIRKLSDDGEFKYLLEMERRWYTGGEIRTTEYVELNCKELIDQILSIE